MVRTKGSAFEFILESVSYYIASRPKPTANICLHNMPSCKTPFVPIKESMF